MCDKLIKIQRSPLPNHHNLAMLRQKSDTFISQSNDIASKPIHLKVTVQSYHRIPHKLSSPVNFSSRLLIKFLTRDNVITTKTIITLKWRNLKLIIMATSLNTEKDFFLSFFNSFYPVSTPLLVSPLLVPPC